MGLGQSLRTLFQRIARKPNRGGLEFHILNAFTARDENTLGNPASICIVDDFPSDAAMGSLAKTLNTAMTTFLKRTDRNDVFEVRHFSPDGNENHICGHALVAATEHLARTFPEFRAGHDITYLVNPKYKLNATNTMSASIYGEKISLALPAVMTLHEVTAPDFYKALPEALGISDDKIVKPAFFAPRANNYLVILKDGAGVVDMKPDFAKLNAISHVAGFVPVSHDGGDIVPFWCVTAKSDNNKYDVFNRVFSPDIGVDEDPACGSANCSIIPYWNGMTGDTDFKVLYPYPPAGTGQVGGVQKVTIDIAREEITLTAEATFQKRVVLPLPSAQKPKGNRPKI